jgi:hypothetical protein
MIDVMGKQLIVGQTIVHVEGGSTPSLDIGVVLEVEDERVKVLKRPAYHGHSPRPSWLKNSQKVAIVELP